MLVTCSRGFRVGIYDGQSGTAYLVAKLILLYMLAKGSRAGACLELWAAGAAIHILCGKERRGRRRRDRGRKRILVGEFQCAGHIVR